MRLVDGLKRFKGIESFETQVAEISERVDSKENRDTLRAGQVFYRVVMAKFRKNEQRMQLMAKYYRRYKKTVYGDAIKAIFDDKERKTKWSDFFIAKNPTAKNYAYPPQPPTGKK